MSNIDTSNWSELRIGDVFEKIDTGKIDGKAGDFPTSRDAKHEIPLLTSSSQNQGLTRFAPRSACPTILSNAITVASNGAAGMTFYQEDEFAVLQDAYAIRPIGRDIPNRECGLFLASVIGAKLRGNFDWFNKANWSKVRELKIKLPVIETEEIDWRYMEKRIAELEAERIAKLEAYLAETGLNDYELTEEDKEVLATKLIDSTKQGGQLQSTTSGDGCWKEAREFRIGDLFDIHPTKIYKMNNSDLMENKGNTPILSNSSRNNGISGYSALPPTERSGIITFSDTTTGADTMFYQNNDFIGYPHVQGMYPRIKEDFGEYQLRYLIAAMQNACGTNWSYSNKFTRKIVANRNVLLPIKMNDREPKIEKKHIYHLHGYIPDWEYMEKYIKSVEKLVIKDVVEYKDDIINKTRELLDLD